MRRRLRQSRIRVDVQAMIRRAVQAWFRQQDQRATIRDVRLLGFMLPLLACCVVMDLNPDTPRAVMARLEHAPVVLWEVPETPDAQEPAVSIADAAELAAYRSRLGREDVHGRIALGSWAMERGLFDEADGLLREALRVMPEDAQAHRALGELWADRALPIDSEAYRAARIALPHGFTETQTRRFVILSDAEPAWTRSQAERLERAHHQFMRFCTRMDLKPLPLRHKLVCVLFQSRESYTTFAREHDHVTEDWMNGYYSPANDRIVFFNIESAESLQEASEELARWRASMQVISEDLERARLRGKKAEAESLAKVLGDLQKRHELEKTRLEQFADAASVSTTIHEAIHQLMFHTRVQTPQIQYPLWISEGLSTSFETDAPMRAFGPDHVFSFRQNRFEELLAEDRLLPLRALVGMMSMPDRDPQTPEVVYHQSYALVRWMSRFRKAELRDYLMMMLREPAGRPTVGRQIELFEKAFGPAANVERAWLRFERSERSRA